jgi:hypothetical protein
MAYLKHILVGIAVVCILAGCSTMQIATDYDVEADFVGLKTYDWLPRPETASADPRINSTLLESRVHNAVDAELAAKGYVKDASGSPDFLVGYHVAVQSQIDVYSMNEFYGYHRGWGWGRSDVHVYEYDQGSLILDVVDPGTKHLLWRGGAEAEVRPSASPEQREERIQKAVRKILERFPPE